MYVRDLKEGCIVKPKGNLVFGMNETSKAWDHAEGAAELAKHGIHYHSTTVPRETVGRRMFNRVYRRVSEGVALYAGIIQLKNGYYGVKKQHIFIIDGMSVAIDGYVVRDLEII